MSTSLSVSLVNPLAGCPCVDYSPSRPELGSVNPGSQVYESWSGVIVVDTPNRNCNVPFSTYELKC